MTDREKLIEILRTKPFNMSKVSGGRLADHLIANGVTVATDTAVAYNLSPTADSLSAKWIPVTERLPESMEWVLGFVSSGAMRVLRYDHIMDDWDTVSRNVCIRKEYVTHWLPLPEPPGNEE